MEDTVTRARQEREKQGPWEVEVSYGGEADLHRHEAGCTKNPGHHKFVPVDQFNVDYLPPGCQDNDLMDLIRAVSYLTVRVSVKYVSEGRPETDPRSGKPYPCYNDRGSDMMRVGTGWVYGMDKYTDEEDKHLDEEDKHLDEEDNRYETCPCQECQISPTPETQFARIYIETAAHVVYDDLEAAHTTCHLFFDKGGTPETCSGVVTLRGESLLHSHVDCDICTVTFVTHDLDLADRLDKMVVHQFTLRKRLKERLERLEAEKLKSSSPAEDLPAAWDDLTIIVSHPHGCSKQISVGSCVDGLKQWGRIYPRTYTTATCPGSSGAHVCWVKGGWGQVIYWGDGIVHTGNCKGNNNLNFCSDYFSNIASTIGHVQADS